MKLLNNPKRESWEGLLKRPTKTVEDIEETVQQIFDDVRLKGDEALLKYTALFDGVNLSQMLVNKEEVDVAITQISPQLKKAIELAKSNIEKFHKAQLSKKIEVETTAGVYCWQEKKPIQKVGLYIPGGSAPLFSSVLMLAVPASIAGCSDIILCTPPGSDGSVDPSIVYTAQLCGIDRIYKVGGIQAIAAMTFGTKTINKVYKIFGPGNQFVTVAKQLATKYDTAIDMPAGPSELLVVADNTAKADFVAADLLSQAEHGIDSQVILISTDEKLIPRVATEIKEQLKKLPRKAIAEKAIANSKLIVVNDSKTALEMINCYGPEHLIICSADEDFYVQNILNAGSVFIGNYTPESAGDYASGTNHTLPTNGYSKQYSGVNTDSFMKSITFQKISENGLKNIGNAIELMAEAEGLQAHKNAVSLRLKSIENESI